MIIWMPRKPAVLAATDILHEAFDGAADVSTKLPSHEPRPVRFVTVTRIGGRQENPVTDDARLRVDCYAKSTFEVEMMSARVSEAFHNAAGAFRLIPLAIPEAEGVVVRAFIRHWSEDSTVDYPHPDILDYERWQVTGTLSVKVNNDDDVRPTPATN